MPATTAYWDAIETESARRDLAERAETERRERADWHARAWRYYEGDHPRPLKVRPNQADNNVIVNAVAQHVEHTVSFAAPEFPLLSVPGDDGETDEAIADAIHALWKAQSDNIWLSNVMTGGVLEGHCFVRILPQDGAPPRFVALNPANVLVYWLDDDFDTALWYEQTYNAGGDKHRLDIIAPGVANNAGWLLRDNVMRQNRYEATAEYPWPFDFPPIWDWQHLPHPNRYYGRHELAHLNIQDGINKVASDIKAILRVHASPKVVGFGIRAKELEETAIDNFWSTPNVDAKLAMIEMTSDLASSMNYLSYLNGQYFQQARVTLLTGGPDAYKGVTNLGIKAAFMSQVSKTETLHALYGDAVATLTQFGLALMGVILPEPPDVTWAQALPESALELAQTEQIKVNMGVESKQTAAENMGINWDEEQERLAADEENAGGALERILTGNAFPPPMRGAQREAQNGNGRAPRDEEMME